MADCLQRGPLTLSDALSIARQLVEALDAAHLKGIIHRDLKPANIVLEGTAGTAPGDSRVKVLDFGIAKTVSPGEADSQRPTSATLDGTEDGRILGTPAYMSPEQARGQAMDKRTDIWAFGCVLFEMLTGRRAFDGEGVTDTLARILEREPDWTAIPRTRPRRSVRCSNDACERFHRSGCVTSRTRGSTSMTVIRSGPEFTRRRVHDGSSAPRRCGNGSCGSPPPSSLAVCWRRQSRRVATSHSRDLGDSVEFEIGPAPDHIPRPLPDFVVAPDGSHLAMVGSSRGGRHCGQSELTVRVSLNSGTREPSIGSGHPIAARLGFLRRATQDRRVDWRRAFRSGRGHVGILWGRGGAWNQDGDILFSPA